MRRNKLLKSVSVVSFMTFLSRIMGFVRDMVFAAMFGATLGFDAFLLAFKIPNFFRRLFAEGAFSQAFVPILSEYRGTRSKEEVNALIHKVSCHLSVVLLGVTAVGMIAAPVLVKLFAPGFEPDGDRAQLATQMLRITFPYLLFISLTALAGGILNTYRKFSVPAFTPVLLNFALIGCAFYLSPQMASPVTALAWGVFIGGVAQLALQLPFLYRLGFDFRLVWDWKDPGVSRILKLMAPALLGASVMQINLLVDTLFASFLPVGSLSWLYYADRMIEFPLGIFGVALATVALPNLSHHYAKKNSQAFDAQCDWALKMSLMVGVPCAIGLGLLATPVIATLFGRGAFGSQDIEMAAWSLQMLAFGLCAFMIIKVLVSAFYAKQNTKYPVKVAIIALLANIVLNALLIGPLAHAGLSLASSISAWLQVVLLAVMLLKMGHRFSGWGAFSLQLIFGNGLMFASLHYLMPNLEFWLDAGVRQQMATLFGLIGLAMVVYLISLWLAGVRPSHFNVENA